MNDERTPKPDNRRGPASLLRYPDGTVVRRKPRHRPWNVAPKKGGNDYSRESYTKHSGEYLSNYDTVPRTAIKREVEQIIEEEMEDLPDNWVGVEVFCPFCGKPSTVTVKKSDWIAFNKPDGPLVHLAFPYLTVDDKELLISGTCTECWDKYMKSDDDEI